jgi:hypothetical protein
MALQTAKPAHRVNRTPVRKTKRRTTDLRVVTDHVVWSHNDRADEGDMLTFRSCDRWMNDPSIWEDMSDERIIAARSKA